MVKSIQKYVCEDGKEFTTREEAVAHEVELEAIANLKQVLASSNKMGRLSEQILREILLESQSISNVLSRYRKRMPKEKEKASV